ncbi:hypothetical protein F8388_004614 [Cannabis sativa]|uniref:Rx N-terminal domain-containing protein n=1 Tax=Cannabis sativa TaxID=3483 RepID=A0A7J6GNF7_CANSA|nr:hypothetical protein F8388_004614 [Cannabis sativa]
MAETFLSPVIDKLLDLLSQQVTLVKGVHREVESLKDELKIIQPFLIDAEKKLAKDELSDAAKEWLKQMREVAERIEDVIDEYLYHLAHNHHHHHRGLIISIRRAAGYIGSVKLRRNLASKIKDINESLLKVQKRGISYGLRHFEEGSSSSRITNRDASVIDPRLGSLFIGEDEFVRIDSTTNELIRSLLEGPTTRSVISKLQNLQGLNLKFSRLTKEPLNCLKQLPNLAFLEMCEAYNGEELCFEEKGFKKLKHLVLRKLEGLKVVKIERGALPLLEKLEFGPFPLMIEMPCDIQFLTNLKSLEIMDMSSEFVDGLQPEEGSHYWKVQHVPYVTFWYRSKRDLYDIYKLGESDLLKLLLQEKASSAIVQQFTNFINVNDS